MARYRTVAKSPACYQVDCPNIPQEDAAKLERFFFEVALHKGINKSQIARGEPSQEHGEFFCLVGNDGNSHIWTLMNS